MPKLRMITFNEDGEVLGHRDFKLPSDAVLKDPILDAMKLVMMNQLFRQAFELVLNHRDRLAISLDRLMGAVEALQGLYDDKNFTVGQILDALRELSTVRARSVLAETTLIDMPGFEGRSIPRKQHKVLNVHRDSLGKTVITWGMEDDEPGRTVGRSEEERGQSGGGGA